MVQTVLPLFYVGFAWGARKIVCKGIFEDLIELNSFLAGKEVRFLFCTVH